MFSIYGIQFGLQYPLTSHTPLLSDTHALSGSIHCLLMFVQVDMHILPPLVVMETTHL